MNKLFQVTKGNRPGKSAFDLSHEVKLTMEMGKLVPVLCQEVVPGDTFKIDTQSLIRLAPLVAPLMHRVNAYIHYFYVPTRILWPGFEDFITGKVEGTVPKKALNGEILKNSLADHLGIPPGTYSVGSSGENVNVLPFYAYYKIWNDYYRDQQLQDEVDFANDTGILTNAVLTRAWEKDYFTSALPTAQLGQPVKMPVEPNYYDQSIVLKENGSPAGAGGEGLVAVGGELETDTSETVRIENISTVDIDIQELRYATRLQRYYEKMIRNGSRYVEYLQSIWGVKSRDSRLQRAEYIGGGVSPVVISEVLNTAATEDALGDPAGLPVGAMAGHGLSLGRTNQAYKFCEEHGFIMAIMSVVPEPNYAQGLPRMFSRMLALDHYIPDFAQLGEQEVLTKEIYLDPADNTSNNAGFGYQSRNAEYKYAASTVHGEFRDTLDHYTLFRKFEEPPQLNEEFIQCVPDVDRIFAVTYDKQHLWIQLYHKITAIRPMPFYNDPTL